MALQYSVAVNNARLDQVEAIIGTSPKLRIFSGSAPANCAAADTGTLLAELSLPSDWMAAAASSSKALAGSWTGTASAGSSTAPTHFRITNTAGSAVGMQGSAGVGSGDLQVNGSITNGQTVTVTSFNLTSPT
ncbi:MAG: uncharacterized protein K0R43_1705 [Pseudoduganella sp.]|jgi:hypothetical protein|nr:uncharacterized protein [Pseudoduganella sp.]